ncbi:PAS domain S-box-containing protein [Rhodoligotrophos appendicifer]|uniref:adenylate/guanylate cyclase domain-containing protein n=1 Tax=Rhodoligotrophos appendicifer TaxID=987056 RepID=UPI0014795D00|nr:adenylate/guanylate cyclase domain-containing protein [Rhodoligotrophos appendicifer]
MKLDHSGVDAFLVLEAASESILVTTADLEPPGPAIVYVNPNFERITGWTASEVVGKSPRVLQGDKTDLSVFLGMRETLRRGDRWEGQAVNYRKDGTEFVMEWSITPLRDAAGTMTHFVAVQRDVSARIEAEKRLAKAQAAARESDRRKTNLARYFSPGMVETLAQRDRPLGPVRRQKIAVLFVDIVGFVGLSESLPPERVVALLRSFYRRLATVIFVKGGSVASFSGDGLMALFGVPNPSRLEATNALHAAIDMMDEMERWNAKRLNAGRSRIDFGISVNFGMVVLGDIGTRESMSFTAIGDTVNTASRMQELCRNLNVRLVASQSLLEQAFDETGKQPIGVTRLSDAGRHHLRGVSLPVQVWTCA